MARGQAEGCMRHATCLRRRTGAAQPDGTHPAHLEGLAARGQVSDRTARAIARETARDRARVARAAEVQAMADELEEHGRLGLTRTYIQHGSVTVYDHVCAVARTSLAMADALARAGIGVDRRSLLRGALLHDYFLYDWHDKDPSHRLHGFRHPFFALERAEEDFDLTPRERNIIVRHMFPLVPIPPTCREAWIVCIADKACALKETVLMRGQRHGSDAVPDASAERARATPASGSATGVRATPASGPAADVHAMPTSGSVEGPASAVRAPASEVSRA